MSTKAIISVLRIKKNWRVVRAQVQGQDIKWWLDLHEFTQKTDAETAGLNVSERLDLVFVPPGSDFIVIRAIGNCFRAYSTNLCDLNVRISQSMFWQNLHDAIKDARHVAATLKLPIEPYLFIPL